MKKKFTKIASCLLCLAMLLSMAAPALAARADDDAVSIEAPAIAEDGGTVLDVDSFFEEVPVASLLAEEENPFDATGEYEIYPTPHSVTYADPAASVTLPETMQVTYTGDIDDYTKARAVEAFEQAGVTLDETATTDVKLQVSIDASLSTKTSAHKVTVGSTGVTVVGVDTDAAFYGLTTVKRILQQVDKATRSVKCLTVEDYADVPFRGFIEGYYGNPWTTEDRVSLMKFGGELKMNIYFYAPKDDPKHNAKWREKYTAEELEQKIRPLAEAGNESKCYFGFAIHPFMYNAIRFDSDANYAADLQILKDKFEQAMGVGVRQIAVLADDAGVPSGNAANYVKLMNDLTEWVSSADMQERYPGLKTSIPFCPNDYMGDASSDQMQTLKDLPNSVPIIQTGGAIWGSVSDSYLTTYRQNMGDKGVFMWVNWPCSDQSKGSLIMGAHDTVLRSDLTQTDIGTLRGIMLNPMQQSEPSKAAIFQNADYAWNVWNGSDSAQRIADVWDDCFKYVDHDSAIETDESAALRELSKHMIHNNGSGWRGDWHESAVLKDTLSAFRDKLSANVLTAADIAAMRAEFETLHDAAVLYKGKTSGNLRILGQRNSDGTYVDNQEQMAPWLDYWVEFTQANLDFLDAFTAIQGNSDGSKNTEIINKYLSGQNNLIAARSHSFLYIDHYETALAGGEYIAPFTNALQSVLAEKVGYLLSGQDEPLKETIITSRTDVADLSALRDGDDSTKITFKNPTSLSIDDYIGVIYSRPISLTSVNFKLGDTSADGGKNTFGACKLQYTADGTTWQDIPGDPTIVNNTMNSSWNGTCRVAEIGIDGLSLNVRGVRVVSTENVGDIWIVAREIYINGKSGAEEEPADNEKLSGTVIKSSTWSVYQTYDDSKAIDGNDSTYAWYDTGDSDDSLVGDYFGLDLGSVQPVGRVRFLMGSDKWSNYKVQYSEDNDTWTDGPSFTTAEADVDLGGVSARYVRFVNTVQVHAWVKVCEIVVWEGTPAVIYQSDVVKNVSNPKGALEDTSATLSADNVILRSGEFVGIALPAPRNIIDIVADYTPAPGLVLKMGMNEAEMEVVNLNSRAAYTGAARYIRLENTGAQTVSFQLNELSVQSEEPPSGIQFLSSTIGGEANGEDARKLGTTGNWFDGNVSTKAKFCAAQVSGQHVTYDLGQTRQIQDLRLIVQDAQKDYPRHAKVQIAASADGPWTDVITIDTSADAGTSAGNDAEGGWVNISAYPNYKSLYGTLDTPQDARYLRVLFTGDFSGRWLELNEIVINGGDTAQAAYVSTFSDPAFEADPAEVSADNTPDKLVDGDLTTAFIPDMEGEPSGSLIYHITDNTSIGQINLVQGETSGVKLSVRPVGKTDFTELATPSGGLTQVTVPEAIANVAEIKLTWSNVTPTFYELVTISREQVAAAGGQAPSEVETIPINSYSGDARKINFDENWKFNYGDVSGAEAQVFNDAAWRTLNLPHDFSIEQDYSGSCEDESGYLPGGTGWYRKSFTVDPSWENKTVSIDFGGAYMDTEVYLNGEKLGEYHYGYTPFSFVLSNLNYEGENVIAVKVVNAIPTSRWYSGSGIYRSVNLTVTNPVHVARYGTYVNPVKESDSDWTVNIKTNVQNDTTSAANVTVEQAIYKLDGTTYEKTGSVVATNTSNPTSVNANATGEVTQTISVSNPSLWNSWDRGTPDLYVLETTVKQDGTEVDTYETEFGFRTIEFDLDDGFKLNGVSTKLKGVCQHHDQGALGAEAWYRALERQVDILMEMGCNSIRVTHNPAADELIEICNRKGILIIDEFFDMWTAYKNGNSNDFARWFNVQIADTNTVFGGEGITWAQLVVETTVGRDQNSPCVIMYSIGNEITTQTSGSTAQYPTIAHSIIGWAQAMDRTRPLTMGDNNKNPGNSSNTLHQIDQILHEAGGVVGYNYAPAETLTAGHEKNDSINKSAWKMYGSETASAVNSRGVYDRKNSNSDGGHGDYRLTSYDKSAVGWGSVASEAWWRTIRFDYNAGEYVWTGFDYIGEPTPWNSTGVRADYNDNIAKSSFFGIIDTNGIPKDSYYLYRAMWMEDGSTTLHVLPTWDEEDLMLDNNGKVEVVVYSNAPVVKVYLNGNEVGTATSTEQRSNGGLYTYRTFTSGTGCYRQNSEDESLYATFNVPYEAGTLEVKAYQADGTTEITDTVGRDVVRTTDRASKLVATADRNTIKNDGKDLSYVTIDVMDSKGEIVNSANNQIKVSVTGDGVLVGMDNGVQGDHTSYQSDTWKAGAGRLVAIIQSTKNEGSFTVTATSPGLTYAAVTVSTGGVTAETGDDTPVSYDLSKTIYVQLNTPPKLPETTTVTLGNGAKETKRITWDSYDDDLTVPGEFAITGTIQDYNIPVSIGVVVLDDVAALLNYSAAVQVGQVPSLPATRPAVMTDGTVVAAQFDVDWQLPEDSVYSKAGTVVVNGTAEAFGKIYNVTATIRVAVGEVVEGDNNSSKADTLTLNGADSQPLQAIRDGDANTSWTGSGDVVFYYNTPLAMSKIKLIYDGVPPASSVMTLYVSPTGMDGSWTPRPIRPTTEGHTVTYNFNGLESAFYIKLAFASEVSLAEAELISGTPVFPIGSTAVLDDLKVNGVSATAAQLAAKEVITSDLNAVIHPISSHNAAVTFLPETADSKVVIVTESEDHNERAVYTVQMNTVPADDDSRDYPYTQTTATAPSQGASSGNNSASAAVDNNANTIWHTSWSGNDAIDLANQPERRYIQLTLQEATDLVALRYLPRNDGLNGRITGYEVWISTADTVTAESKDTFTKVSEGTWANDANWKIALFNAPTNAKHVRLYGVVTQSGEANAKVFVSAAEVRLVKTSDKIDLSEAIVTVEPDSFAWRGGVGIRPGTGTEGATVTVTLRGQTLTLGTDYELAYENNFDPGTAYIYARARADGNYQGAAMTSFTIYKSDAKIRSFVPVTVAVQPGIDPTPDLPDTLMANTDDGLTLPVAIDWNVIDPTWYNFPQEKTRTLQGTVVDASMVDGETPTPELTLHFAYSQSVDGISMVTTEGVIPTLPETVTVRFDDGSSGERTVSKWYLASNKDADPIPALTATDFAAGTTVQLMGNIVGINRVKASASVRVAGEDSEMTYVPGTTNIALNNNSGSNIFPMALGFVSAGNNNPYQAIKGQTTGSTAATDRWSDWESGTYHTNPKPWMGAAFETSTQNVTRKEGQVLTLVPHKVNKANVMFVDEGGGTSGAVTFPESYKIQYYTGSVTDLTFDTRLSAQGSLDGNGRVRSWTNSPLLDDSNWADVTVIGTQPDVPAQNGQMLTVTFQPVDTAILRVLCTPKANKWVGIQALEVYEAVAVPVSYDDFTVTSITLDGTAQQLSSFVDSGAAEGKVLEVSLPANDNATAGIPTLAITADNNASVSVVQATRVPGLPQAGRAWAQAVVTSEDGSTTETYTVKFTREGSAVGYFIETDDSFPSDKIQLVNDLGQPITGAAINEKVTIKTARGYESTVRVVITSGDQINQEVTVANDHTFLMPAANVHVYATASPITYHITYLLGGGSFTGTPRGTYNVETATFSVNDPTRPGYTFQGWVGGGLTQATKRLTIAKGSIGDRTYTAVWETSGTIGGGGGNNSGGSSGGSSTPVGDVTVTTKNPDGSTTVTTTTPGGLVSAVTTAPDGTQSAVIQIPENSGSSVNAVMPELDVTGGKTPEVSVQNNTTRPLSVTLPINGANTVVAIRTNADGTETVIPYSVVDENGLRVKVESGDQTLKLVDNAKDFTDVPDSHWAAETVDFVSSRELFNGMGSTTTFAPTAPMDRAMMTTVLWRLAEKPDAVVTELFDDVVSGAYYEQAVAWGVATGVVKGTDNGFEPNSPVTRETLAVMLYRAAGSPAVVDELPRHFVDGAQVADWAQEAMIWCIQNDIIKGYPDSTLGAKNAATRAEVATMLQRFVIHQI